MRYDERFHFTNNNFLKTNQNLFYNEIDGKVGNGIQPPDLAAQNNYTRTFSPDDTKQPWNSMAARGKKSNCARILYMKMSSLTSRLLKVL